MESDHDRQAMIIAQATLKAAAEFMGTRDGGYVDVTKVAEAFERWVFEAPTRSVRNLADRVAAVAVPHVAPEPAPQPLEPPAAPFYDCPQCGSPMRIKSGTYGQFYGCSRYPECKGTRDISGKVKVRG